MLRRSRPAAVRVIVATMVPNGGNMVEGLQRLGLKPYTAATLFSPGGHTHARTWADWLTGKMQLDRRMVDDYDAVIGMPLARHTARELANFPSHTKVILVRERDKLSWQQAIRTQYLPGLDKLRDEAVDSPTSPLLKFVNIFERGMVLPDANNMEGWRGIMASMPSKEELDESNREMMRKFRRGELQVEEPDLGPSKPIQSEEGQPPEPTDAPPKDGGLSSLAGTTSNLADEQRVSDEATDANPIAIELEQWEEEIIANVPKQRLLVYTDGDGYRPIAEFLGMKSLPEELDLESFPVYDNGMEWWEDRVDHMIDARNRQRDLGKLFARCCVISGLVVGYFVLLPYVAETIEEYQRVTGSHFNSPLKRFATTGIPDSTEVLRADAEKIAEEQQEEAMRMLQGLESRHSAVREEVDAFIKQNTNQQASTDSDSAAAENGSDEAPKKKKKWWLF